MQVICKPDTKFITFIDTVGFNVPTKSIKKLRTLAFLTESCEALIGSSCMSVCGDDQQDEKVNHCKMEIADCTKSQRSNNNQPE